MPSRPDPLCEAFRRGFVRAWLRAEIGRWCQRIRPHPMVLATYRAAIARWCRQRREARIIEAERGAGEANRELSEAALCDQGGLDHCGIRAP
jgi:hypothetical protein